MNRRNYPKELDKTLEIWSREHEGRPSLLLHCCCGPCSGGVLEYLAERFDVTVFWYNPNIYPAEEFELRLATLKELIGKMGLSDRVGFIETEYRPEEYYAAVKGLETEPEGGARCAQCFRLRLEETALVAKEKKFDFFCSTLTVSRHKNAVVINALGENAAEKYGGTTMNRIFRTEADRRRLSFRKKAETEIREEDHVTAGQEIWKESEGFSRPVWLPSEFKRRGGEDRSRELAEEYGLYRQVYCGCEFSYKSREENSCSIRNI